MGVHVFSFAQYSCTEGIAVSSCGEESYEKLFLGLWILALPPALLRLMTAGGAPASLRQAVAMT